MLLDLEVGRNIESSGRNADRIAPDLIPKQIAAADAAESPFCRVRRLVPAQTAGSRHLDIRGWRARHGRIVSARSAALRAVAGNDSTQRAANPITDSPAQATAGMCRFSFRHLVAPTDVVFTTASPQSILPCREAS